MKHLLLLIFSLLLFACSNGKKAYWCGDHACINNKEKEAYFKKTMIVEVKEIKKSHKKTKSEFEVIKKQTIVKEKRKIKEEKELSKQVRLEEKKRIKEEKKLSKQVRLEEKKRIKEEKKISKIKKKLSKNEIKKPKKTKVAEQVVKKVDDLAFDVSEFDGFVEKISKKNMLRPFPDINDIPN